MTKLLNADQAALMADFMEKDWYFQDVLRYSRTIDFAQLPEERIQASIERLRGVVVCIEQVLRAGEAFKEPVVE